QALTSFGIDLQNLLPDVLSYFLVYIKILRFPNCAWAVWVSDRREPCTTGHWMNSRAKRRFGVPWIWA
ncbi:hypothetical protein, partial [Anaerotruncus colihominis]|uniref:hypothetical protein n=1 Tax=Anaerotruncus colihominis TaxID=169435 RepID=UPI001A9B9729